LYFELSTWLMAVVLITITFGATLLGWVVGKSLGAHREMLREPLGAVQGALLTLVALILAFGLAMAVGRYETRRVAVVDDANAIGTAYLRAQTLHEPVRSLSLPLYKRYIDASILLGKTKPGNEAQHRAIATESAIQRRLWHLAGQTLDAQPTQSAPRLYLDSLNTMIDMQTTRVAGLGNRVPTEISLLQVVGTAVALGLLALYLTLMSRGVITVLLAATPPNALTLRHVRPRPASTRLHHHLIDTTRDPPDLDGTPTRRRSTHALAPTLGNSAMGYSRSSWSRRSSRSRSSGIPQTMRSR